MRKAANSKIQTLPLDHHGIVAATCKDLRIAERIDACIGVHDKRQVTPGQSVVAMILNGLGFTDRRLYLTSQFFASKPVELLLDAPIQASELNDYTLGHTLDEISDYGVSSLFGRVAFGIALDNNLMGNINHLDTTSMNVTGEYNVDETDELGPASVQVTYGHSKDHRPDLKQVVLSLVVNGPSQMPLWMEPQNGNSSDKATFHETIKRVRAFQKQIDVKTSFKWVADSALYSKEKLLANNDYIWLTRVPETITEAKELVSTEDSEISWDRLKDGYKKASYQSCFGNIKQRWLLIYSEKAYLREKKTFQKNLAKKEEALQKAIWHLGNKAFGCAKDIESEVTLIQKQFPLHKIESQILPIESFGKKGKPRANEKPTITGYSANLSFTLNQIEIESQLNKKGRFILATNELNTKEYSNEKMLSEYKEQQNVERGFRFLKDPWFMVDSIFLKSPRRIESLMMVMTLCLLVYNIAQYNLRKKLKEENETLPNQLDKEIQNPTLRWIFQIMEGIGMVRFYENRKTEATEELVTNISALREKIIQLFGPTACSMYGLIPNKC